MSFDAYSSYADQAGAAWNQHASAFTARAASPQQLAPGIAMPARSPEVGQALALGFGALLLPVLGPMAWMHAGEELAKMQTGEVRPVDQSWLMMAKALGMLASAIAASATIMLIVFAVVV